MITPKAIYDHIIGYPEKELGDEQPEKSLFAVNQTVDADDNYIYGFDLHKMFYNSGDITNWFDLKEDGDEIFGCFYLGTTLRAENSLVDEIDYFFQLVFKVPEDLRDNFQIFFDDFIKHQIGNYFYNEDRTKEYSVEFSNGASAEYSEKADDDGKDFLASVVITIVETNPVNKFNDINFYIQYTNIDGDTIKELVKYTAYNESRQTSVESQITVNEADTVYWANSSDFNISFTLPAIKDNALVKIIDDYRNNGNIQVFTLIKENTVNPIDTFEKRFIINQVAVNTTGIGPIVYTIALKRVK